MQNKGFVKVFALLLTLVCVFYLSFSFVTTYQMNKVDEITKTQGEEAGAHYLDSVMNNPVWLGAYSLKDCREMEISERVQSIGAGWKFGGIVCYAAVER